MTIEFVGLPGVGKSTIARAFEEHGFKRIEIGGKAELLWRNLQFMVRYPRAFFTLLNRIARTGSRYGRTYQFFRSTFLMANARTVKALSAETPAIIDHGHLQGLLSISYHEIDHAEIRAYRKHLPAPDRVFFLVVDESERIERLTRRGRTPRENEKNVHNALWEKHLAANAERLKNYLIEEPGTGCQVFSTTVKPSGVVKIIRSRL